MKPEEKSLENDINTTASSSTLRGSSLIKEDPRLESPSPEESPAITAETTPKKTLNLATTTVLNNSTGHSDSFFQPPLLVSLKDALATLADRIAQKEHLHQAIKQAAMNFMQKPAYLTIIKNDIHSKYPNETNLTLAISYTTNTNSGVAEQLFLTINQDVAYEISLDPSNNETYQP